MFHLKFPKDYSLPSTPRGGETAISESPTSFCQAFGRFSDGSIGSSSWRRVTDSEIQLTRAARLGNFGSSSWAKWPTARSSLKRRRAICGFCHVVLGKSNLKITNAAAYFWDCSSRTPSRPPFHFLSTSFRSSCTQMRHPQQKMTWQMSCPKWAYP